MADISMLDYFLALTAGLSGGLAIAIGYRLFTALRSNLRISRAYGEWLERQ